MRVGAAGELPQPAANRTAIAKSTHRFHISGRPGISCTCGVRLQTARSRVPPKTRRIRLWRHGHGDVGIPPQASGGIRRRTRSWHIPGAPVSILGPVSGADHHLVNLAPPPLPREADDRTRVSSPWGRTTTCKLCGSTRSNSPSSRPPSADHPLLPDARRSARAAVVIVTRPLRSPATIGLAFAGSRRARAARTATTRSGPPAYLSRQREKRTTSRRLRSVRPAGSEVSRSSSGEARAVSD